MKFIVAATVAALGFAAGAAAQAELVAAVGTNFAAIPDCVKTCLTASAFTVPPAPYDADEITSICTQGLLLSTDAARAATIAGCVNTAEPACSAASADGSTLSNLLSSVVTPCAQLSGLATGAPLPATTTVATTTTAIVSVTAVPTTTAKAATTTAAPATNTKSGAEKVVAPLAAVVAIAAALL